MKMYVVKNKTTKDVFGKFDTQNQASEKLVEYITENNEGYCSNEAGFLSIFDFEVKEEEVQEVASYEDAKAILGLSDESLMTICGVSKHHAKGLLALSKLFTIAEAWNKEDGFVPDFSNEEQRKYFPWFEYNKGAAGFVCVNTDWTATYAIASAGVGSRLCFATRERAIAFGTQFKDLYNDFLLLDK